MWDRVRPETTTTIVDGGIGSPFVTINISTLPGQRINSLFRFYISQPSGEIIPKVLDNYSETIIDLEEE